MDCCEHDNDISGSMNALCPLTLSDSQKFGAIDLVYNFYAVLFFFVTFSYVVLEQNEEDQSNRSSEK